MAFSISTVLSCAGVSNWIFNDWGSEDCLNTLMVVFQRESVRANNSGRLECSAFVTKVGCAWRADPLWLSIFCPFALLSTVICRVSFWALAICWYGHFSVFARHYKWLNFNVIYALLSFKLSVFAHFACWFTSNTFACWLEDKFLDSCRAFLCSSLCRADVTLAWRCAIECLFPQTSAAFLLEAIGANVSTIKQWIMRDSWSRKFWSVTPKPISVANGVIISKTYLGELDCWRTHWSPLATEPPGHSACGAPWTLLEHWE